MDGIMRRLLSKKSAQAVSSSPVIRPGRVLLTTAAAAGVQPPIAGCSAALVNPVH
jgi:hypothetical protein